MLNRETVAVTDLAFTSAADANFDWSCAEPFREYEPPSHEEVEAYFFEAAYDYLTEAQEVIASLREPFSYRALNSTLWNWLPAKYASRFVAGTLVCIMDNDPYRPLYLSTPDKMFFAFSRAVDRQVREDLSDSPFTFQPLGVAAIRARSGAAAPPRYHFLMEIPEDYTLADMKHVCFTAGAEVCSKVLHPMRLVGCESASEWGELLMARHRPCEYIESFVNWHWRKPLLARKKAPRKGWTRKRVLSAIKRAA